MQIIKVPSIYSCKLPGGEWLNLALVRRLEFELNPPVAIVTWSNGDSQVYNDAQALAIVQAWEEVATKIDKSNSSEREVLEVLRRRGGEMPVGDLVSIFPGCFPTLNKLKGRGIITFRDGGVFLVEASSSSIVGEDVVVQRLVAVGAGDALIEAVLEGDDRRIEQALSMIENQRERRHFTEIVQRLGPIQGKAR